MRLMDKNKQTAVEWLIGDLNQKIDFIPMDKWDMIRDIIQKALAMEKEQIIDAYEIGFDEGLQIITKYDTAQDYYNETYGK